MCPCKLRKGIQLDSRWHMCTQKAVLSKPLWRCWSTAVISSIFHIPHLIHLRMPLKEDKGVRVTNQPRLHRNSSLLQAIWHRGVNTFCPMLNAARVEHVSEQTSQLLRDSGGVTWSVFFFFFRVLCERKKKKKGITVPQVMPSVASSFTCKNVNALLWAHAQIFCSRYTIVQLRT